MASRQKETLRRRFQQILVILVAALLLAYPVDWAVWRVRTASGRGMGTVNVTSTTAATLKGNHYEVYGQDTTPVECSRSLLPEAGAGPCWWLRRNPQVITQY